MPAVINGDRTVKFIKAKQKPQGKGGLSMPVDTKENKIKEPNLNVELFWSVFKVMAALIVFVIIVFGGLLLHYINKTTTLTTHSIEMTQDGQDNNQSLTNG